MLDDAVHFAQAASHADFFISDNSFHFLFLHMSTECLHEQNGAAFCCETCYVDFSKDAEDRH